MFIAIGVTEVIGSMPSTLIAAPRMLSAAGVHRKTASSPSSSGVVNCIEGFSTFKCQTLVNVHDVAVLATHRGQGVGEQMLAVAETEARRRGACKLTLEVLDGNRPAMRLYERCGFAPYQLDPAMGQARFLQKWLT